MTLRFADLNRFNRFTDSVFPDFFAVRVTFLLSRSGWSRAIDLPHVIRMFCLLNYTSMIENVGIGPRLCVPGAACYHYTTFSVVTTPTGLEPVLPERQSGVLTFIL